MEEGSGIKRKVRASKKSEEGMNKMLVIHAHTHEILERGKNKYKEFHYLI